MNEEERQRLIESIKAAIDEKIKAAGLDPNAIAALKSQLTTLEQAFSERGTILPGSARAVGPNPFASEQFISRLKLLTEGHLSTGRIPLKDVGLQGLKSLISTPGAGGSGAYPTQVERGPIIPYPTPPISIIDLLRSTPVISDTYEFVQLIRESGGAAVQANQGDQKAETVFGTALQTAKIATIAHWTSASKQVLSDTPQLSTFLSLLLGNDVRLKFENLVVNGNGTTDKIHGLVPQATPYSSSMPHAPDRISECIAAMRIIGYTPSIIALNPLDWSDFETERAEMGDGQYVAGGGWSTPNAPTMWRLPVAQAAALAQGHALVIDPSRVLLLDRQEVNVLVSTEDRDNLIKNLITMLAEMRGGLAVLDTGGVMSVDLTGS